MMYLRSDCYHLQTFLALIPRMELQAVQERWHCGQSIREQHLAESLSGILSFLVCVSKMEEANAQGIVSRARSPGHDSTGHEQPAQEVYVPLATIRGM